MSSFTKMAEDWIKQHCGDTPTQSADVPALTLMGHTEPADEPEAWREPFRTWISKACVLRHRCSGGISCLHVHFAEWCAAGDQVCPPTRLTFERLLNDARFIFSDGLVEGLLLREDVDAATLKKAPTASRRAARI
jgi:hypothetical protein